MFEPHVKLKMMRNKTKTISAYIFVCTLLSSFLAFTAPIFTQDEITVTTIQSDSIEVITNPREDIKNELILEAENYIYSRFPRTHNAIPTSIVEHGLEHEIDIMFMMAQTQIETNFGTLGAGRETSRRSLFGVASRKYKTYNEAIADYVSILKKFYLTKGRTEQHLMRKYTTSKGGRYAENPNYEAELRGAYVFIDKKTNIKQLQHKYKSIKEED